MIQGEYTRKEVVVGEKEDKPPTSSKKVVDRGPTQNLHVPNKGEVGPEKETRTNSTIASRRWLRSASRARGTTVQRRSLVAQPPPSSTLAPCISIKRCPAASQYGHGYELFLYIFTTFR